MKVLLLSLCLLIENGALDSANCGENYFPTWFSLDNRPLPDWFDKAKVGIFVNWGVYTVPGFGSEWFWGNYKAGNSTSFQCPSGLSYYEFANDFKGEFFDADLWAKILALSGARYVVFTSKDREGYTMWPSTYSFGWNSMDVGLHRDIVGDLSKAVRNRGLRFGLYYSLSEWFNYRYLADKKANFSTQDYVEHKMLPEMKEMVVTYEPDIIWSSGASEANDDYFKSKEFLAWLYNESPIKQEVVVNDRWGCGTVFTHGGFFTTTYKCSPNVFQYHKWENSMSINRHSCGYRRNSTICDYYFPNTLIKAMVQTVSRGGNMLFNVSPTKEGTIIPIYQERLLQLGSWLNNNGYAIYETAPFEIQKDAFGDTWYTASPKHDIVYAILLKWPTNNVAQLGNVSRLFLTSNTKVEMGFSVLNWTLANGTISIPLPKRTFPSNVFDVSRASVLKITNFTNSSKYNF